MCAGGQGIYTLCPASKRAAPPSPTLCRLLARREGRADQTGLRRGRRGPENAGRETDRLASTLPLARESVPRVDTPPVRDGP